MKKNQLNEEVQDLRWVLPDEEDFKAVTEAFIDCCLKGSSAKAEHQPAEIGRQVVYGWGDLGTPVKYIVVASLLGWKELVEALKTACILVGWKPEDLKETIRELKSTQIVVLALEDLYEKYCAPALATVKVSPVQVTQPTTQPATQVSSTTSNTSTGYTIKVLAQPNATFYRIVAYDPKYGNPGARRHFYLTKKIGNSYRVSLGGATVTSWYNEPFFDSVQQAEDFIKRTNKANTSKNTMAFNYTITDKPVASGTSNIISDLSSCVLITSDCGPAYIHTSNQYCVESIIRRPQQLYFTKKSGNSYCDHISPSLTTPTRWCTESILSKIWRADAFSKQNNSCCKEALKGNLAEDIEKHEELNPALFDTNTKLKPEVKDKIIEIVAEFLKEFSKVEVELEVQDVILTGSNASYNYTKDSDLDIHIIADTSNIEDTLKLHKVIYDAYKSNFNRKFEIELNSVPVELYVETQDTPLVSNGIYSVLEDEWVKEPTKDTIPELDQEVIAKAFKPWEKRYKTLVAATNEKTKDESKIDKFIDSLYDLRKQGLSTEGEYSLENLVFKEMRNNGYLDHLKQLRQEVIARRLSLQF